MHVISLCSYAATHPGSLQHRWLTRDLRALSRLRTPWVVVMMHAPWYNSNHGHRAEAELMRQHMEPLLHRHRVDLVLSGHVHACEPQLAWEALARTGTWPGRGRDVAGTWPGREAEVRTSSERV